MRHLQGADVSSFFTGGRLLRLKLWTGRSGRSAMTHCRRAPPPPLPAQYSQGAQPSANTALGLHAHTKGAHGEGRRLRSGQTTVAVRLMRLMLDSCFLSKSGFM